MTSKNCPCQHCEESRRMIATRIDCLYAAAFVAILIASLTALTMASRWAM